MPTRKRYQEVPYLRRCKAYQAKNELALKILEDAVTNNNPGQGEALYEIMKEVVEVLKPNALSSKD